MNNAESSTRRRLIIELAEFRKDNSSPGNSISAIQTSSLKHWIGTIHGPENTPYEGGVFKLDIKLDLYPHQPPEIYFLTKIYHPNVDLHGNIGLNILREDWCPALRIESVLLSISAFLNDPFIGVEQPEADASLNSEAAELYIRDPAGFDQRAREWTRHFAQGRTDITNSADEVVHTETV